MRWTLLLIILVSLFLLLACEQAECEQDLDCSQRTGFTAQCIDGTCQYEPIPGQCGNQQCEEGENKCTCPQDCGTCEGKVPGSQYLTQQCVNNECLPNTASKPVFSSADVRNKGDLFSIDTIHNQPFNMKKDTFAITITLKQPADRNSNHEILNAELTATTANRRTVTLGRKAINKHLWAPGDEITENLILGLPGELEGELLNLILRVDYAYDLQQAGKATRQQDTFQNRYREKFTFVNPDAVYPCPNCDDNNPATRDVCGPQTGFFCQHEPLPNVCGNYACDSGENKCTCPQDCGPCSGSAGEYTAYLCQQDQCVTQLKPSITPEPQSIFDERSLGPVELANTYQYSIPFDVSEDTLSLDFSIYQKEDSISTVTIETIRVLEGQQQLAEEHASQALSTQPSTIDVTLPSIIQPEEEHTLTLAVWYKYVQNGEEKRGQYSKSLGKLILIK